MPVSQGEFALFLTAGLMVLRMRAALWLLPFRKVRQIVASQGRVRQVGCVCTSTIICRAVIISSRCVPGATCLTQALAAQALLARQGLTAKLCIGVAKNGQRIRAHAWLENPKGEVLIGHSDLDQLVRLER